MDTWSIPQGTVQNQFPLLGYAYVNVEAVRKWQAMILQYVKLSPRLCRVYCLLNIEHGLKASDEWMLDQLAR